MTFSPQDKMRAYEATAGLPGRAVIEPDVDALTETLAGAITAAAHERVTKAGVFHLALSGGNTPKVLFKRLLTDPLYRDLPWPSTHVWLVDDRCVEADDDRYNSKMIQEYVINHVDMEPGFFHPMPVLESDGDTRYEDDLRTALGADGCENRLDFVLLGMGGDAHTASLFPHTPAIGERAHWVVFNDGDSVAEPRPRMTMTYPLINSARQIAILVTGESKHATLQRVAVVRDDVPGFPITGVEAGSADTDLAWYLDAAAALGRVDEADSQG